MVPIKKQPLPPPSPPDLEGPNPLNLPEGYEYLTLPAGS